MSPTISQGSGFDEVIDIAQPVSVDDNGGSLTVDNPTLSITGGGVEAPALRVTIANDSTGLLSVDDNGGSLTVDNAVAANLNAQVVGNIAHDAIDAGNPVKVGGYSSNVIPGAVGVGDRVNAYFDLSGRLAIFDGGITLSIDDGAGSITVDNPTLSVVGGGLEATALRVTIANDSTGLLSVDDNGGSLTVDNPILSVVGGGTEATAQRVTIANDSTGVLTVDDGGGSLSVDDAGGSLTIDNAALSVTGGGTEATALRVTIANDSTGLLSVDDNGGSLTVDNPILSVVGGGTEATAQRVTIANDSTGVLSVDDGAGSLTVDQATAANLNAQVVGNVAHDAVDSGNPVKIGAKVIDYEPDSSGEQGFAEVATNDRANIAANLRGEIVPAVKSEYWEPDNIDTTYDDDPTTATSSWHECWQYRKACFGFELDKANTPTDILIEIECDLGDGNAKKLMNDWLGDWRYDDTAVGSGIEECTTFDIACDRIRIKVTCTGTDATNTFTMANSVLYLRT